MDEAGSTKGCGKSLRPVRSRRFSRKNYILDQRPIKRLFTPEIKRYLKDWLVRRRENPYPNREEKKFLAKSTGLTYIQICNWFANWRRKLKNIDNERSRNSWGHLIKSYNDKAQGNVEQFSICSNDSIWEDQDQNTFSYDLQTKLNCALDTSNSSSTSQINENQCYVISSTTEEATLKAWPQNDSSDFSCFKSNEGGFKVLPSCHPGNGKTLMLSKWLESAARFQPNESNYSLWDEERRRASKLMSTKHGKAEVEAAFALTALAATTAHDNCTRSAGI